MPSGLWAIERRVTDATRLGADYLFSNRLPGYPCSSQLMQNVPSAPDVTRTLAPKTPERLFREVEHS